MKRIFDLVLVFVSLPVSVPVILACMAIVRLTSDGAAIFHQTRIGLHEKPFTCYKLRTMRENTREAPSHEVEAEAVIPVGRWLRRLKLDELPQLYNIVRGDMSLVGPRPCLPSQTRLMAARRARGIFSVRPGITGISQVEGIDMSDPERLAASDARYLQNRSFIGDLKIIFLTIAGAGRGDAVM